MKAKIHLSNNQTVEVEGVQSLEHANNVAQVLACNYSASYGRPVHVSTVFINEMNLSAHPDASFWMEGVTLISSIGG